MFRSDPEVQGMARAMWVDLYASEVEEAGLGKELGPGAGGDWMDVAPDTPPEAEDVALLLVGRFEAENDMVFVAIEQRAFAKANIEDVHEADDEIREEFGHYMAMRAMGSGVSWEDNYPE